MKFSEPDLANGLIDGLVQGASNLRSQAQNVAWDECVSASRQNFYETEGFGARGADWANLARRQSDYVRRFVRTVGTPHTFDGDFDPVWLGEVDHAQHAVRLESLVRPLKDFGCSFDQFASAIEEEDTGFLSEFVDVWNAGRDKRPAFATFLRELAGELAEGDWPNRLRDKLGLAHYAATIEPEPVVLMRYSVSEVLAEAETAFAMTMPTVLDSDPWEHFFPAPRDLQYGRAMALTPCEGDETLVAEFLHSRIAYRSDHIFRVGKVDVPAPVHDVASLRDLHLLALQIASGRMDFGI